MSVARCAWVPVHARNSELTNKMRCVRWANTFHYYRLKSIKKLFCCFLRSCLSQREKGDTFGINVKQIFPWLQKLDLFTVATDVRFYFFWSLIDTIRTTKHRSRIQRWPSFHTRHIKQHLFFALFQKCLILSRNLEQLYKQLQ